MDYCRKTHSIRLLYLGYVDVEHGEVVEDCVADEDDAAVDEVEELRVRGLNQSFFSVLNITSTELNHG